MRIISANVNCLRAAIRKGFNDWLADQDADFVCLQETKARSEELVVVGHYWRGREKGLQFVEGPDLFVGTDPEEPLGAPKRVMCIDYSIGGRSKERASSRGFAPYKSALAAYRLHEDRPAELVFSPG